MIAVEKDPRMVEILKERLKDFKNIEVINSDILKWEPKYKILNTKYKIVGNLPFYLTAPVIRQFLEGVEIKPQYMVLVVQKEVGQRICARPPKMSVLSVSVQIYAQPEIISYLPRKSFWPQPKVDSTIIKITPKKLRVGIDKEKFFKIVKAGFSQPRKQLINNLSKGLKAKKEKVENWLLKNNIQPIQRAETLSINDWLKLTKSFKIKK